MAYGENYDTGLEYERTIKGYKSEKLRLLIGFGVGLPCGVMLAFMLGWKSYKNRPEHVRQQEELKASARTITLRGAPRYTKGLKIQQ